jgi:hypothetical protein
MFHIYRPKVYTGNHMSQIKYNHYMDISKDYMMTLKQNGTVEDSITLQEWQPGQRTA